MICCIFEQWFPRLRNSGYLPKSRFNTWKNVRNSWTYGEAQKANCLIWLRISRRLASLTNVKPCRTTGCPSGPSWRSTRNNKYKICSCFYLDFCFTFNTSTTPLQYLNIRFTWRVTNNLIRTKISKWIIDKQSSHLRLVSFHLRIMWCIDPIVR